MTVRSRVTSSIGCPKAWWWFYCCGSSFFLVLFLPLKSQTSAPLEPGLRPRHHWHVRRWWFLAIGNRIFNQQNLRFLQNERHWTKRENGEPTYVSAGNCVWGLLFAKQPSGVLKHVNVESALTVGYHMKQSRRSHHQPTQLTIAQRPTFFHDPIEPSIGNHWPSSWQLPTFFFRPHLPHLLCLCCGCDQQATSSDKMW